MKVKILRDFSCTINGNNSQGDIVEFNDGYAKHLIENGLATEVKTRGRGRRTTPTRTKTASKK